MAKKKTKLTTRQIRMQACEYVAKRKKGVHYRELCAHLIPNGSSPQECKRIKKLACDLPHQCPEKVSRPERAWFEPVTAPLKNGAVKTSTKSPNHKELKESDFYPLLVEWFKSQGIVNEAVVLGTPWTTKKGWMPDVYGISESGSSDFRKYSKAYAAEVKTDPGEYVTAFGQASAFRLHSEMVDVAMPTSMTEEHLDHLVKLCELNGIGLVLFDLDLKKPNFQRRVPAQEHCVDPVWANQFIKHLKKYADDQHKELFG